MKSDLTISVYPQFLEARVGEKKFLCEALSII